MDGIRRKRFAECKSKLAMIYIKTNIFSEAEFKFIRLQLKESEGIVNKLIIAQGSHSHSGLPLDSIENALMSYLTLEERARVIFLFIDLKKVARIPARTVKDHHYNEKYVRGSFVHYVPLKRDDIVISVDSDEIIYRSFLEKILAGEIVLPAKLKLRQFFYNYQVLWDDANFIAPTVAKFSFATPLWLRKIKQWRYQGRLWQGYAGVHLSWFLSSSEMIRKLKNYSHAAEFAHIANEEKLKKAITNCEYIFDEREVKLRKLSIEEQRSLLPESFWGMIEEFKYLICD